MRSIGSVAPRTFVKLPAACITSHSCGSATIRRMSTDTTQVWSNYQHTISPSKLLGQRLLKAELDGTTNVIAPCAGDALSAQLIQRNGFDTMMLSGFCVSAHKGMPDTGLLSYGELLAVVYEVMAVAEEGTAVIVDADTGYGNEVNAKRAVKAFAKAGVAAVMIEDQTFPKRCGYTHGKGVVSRHEAVSRVQAACDAKKEGADILILARTDANGVMGLEEAIERCKAFREVGADITHISGLKSEEECFRYTKAVTGLKMYNNNSASFVLPPDRLRELGFALVIYPDLLLGSAIKAMNHSLLFLKDRQYSKLPSLSQHFDVTKRAVGFDAYDEQLRTYAQVQEELRKKSKE